MATREYSRIFEPIKIGKVEIKNRIAMAPMGVGGLTTPEGAFSQRAINYYIERARGGTGLIITSACKRIGSTVQGFRSIILRMSFTDLQPAALHFFPIQLSNCLISFTSFKHLHKCKSAGPSGVSICYYFEAFNFSKP